MSQRDPIHRSRRTFVAAAGVLFAGAAVWPAGASNAKKLRIGVVGSGNIGGTIGGLWVDAVEKGKNELSENFPCASVEAAIW